MKKRVGANYCHIERNVWKSWNTVPKIFIVMILGPKKVILFRFLGKMLAHNEKYVPNWILINLYLNRKYDVHMNLYRGHQAAWKFYVLG